METFFLQYNRPAPEYNRPAPEYNHPAPAALLLTQKGLSWDFKFLHGLLTHKNKKIPMKKNFGDPPTLLKKPILGV